METVTCTHCGGRGKVPSPTALRQIRTDAGLTLQELARQSGFSAPYLSDVERGNRGVSLRVAEVYEALL